MPENNVNDLITDREIAFAYLCCRPEQTCPTAR
jgi:hypothetical protein